MDLADWSKISQIFIAIAGSIVAAFAIWQHLQNQKNKRVDIAISAMRDWSNSLNEYTSAAIALASDFREDDDILNNLKNNMPITLQSNPRTTQRYGFLMEKNSEIPGIIVNQLRMSLVNYLNASEIIAELRDKKRADNSIIEEQFEPAFRAKVFERLISFMNKYDKNSWKYVRELMDELGK